MRTILAIAIVLGVGIAADATAQADRKRAVKPRDYAAQPRSNKGEKVECERARNEDPTGEFASYPCWARETFARGRRGGGDRYD